MSGGVMSIQSEIEALTSPGLQGSDTKLTNTPEGWRPRLEVDASGGFLISTPRNAGEIPDAVEILKEFKLDPNAWRVVNVRKSQWQRYDGEWLEAQRLTIVPATLHSASDSDAELLLTQVTKWRPRAGIKPFTGDLTGVFAVGDTQYGKDAGDGTEGTIKRFRNGLDGSVARLKELRKMGRSIGTVCLPQLGDCIEGMTSQNGKVLGRSDLGVSFQVRLGRRLLLEQVKAFAPLVDELIVPVIDGNHDQVHRMLLTDPVDSWQIEIVSAVQDACAENPALANVKFRFPERDNSTLAIAFGETTLGIAHGHQFKDAEKWLSGQALGQTPVGSADILLTAHYHHFQAKQLGKRLWLQVPALDGGSPWFRNSRGLEAPAGLLSFVIGDGYSPMRDLAILGVEQR